MKRVILEDHGYDLISIGRPEHAVPRRYLLPRISVKGLLWALGFVLAILGATAR